jgi:hypothetical protein
LEDNPLSQNFSPNAPLAKGKIRGYARRDPVRGGAMKRLRPKLTYANVMATIAVFIALGGASYAATKLPKNSVGSKQIKANAVTSKR